MFGKDDLKSAFDRQQMLTADSTITYYYYVLCYLIEDSLASTHCNWKEDYYDDITGQPNGHQKTNDQKFVVLAANLCYKKFSLKNFWRGRLTRMGINSCISAPTRCCNVRLTSPQANRRLTNLPKCLAQLQFF